MAIGSYTTQWPKANPGLLSWIVADDCADGSLATWNNRAIFLKSFTQAVVASRPIAASNVLAGHKVVSFDGIDDFMVNETPYPLPNSNTTIFVVVKARASGGRLFTCSTAAGGGTAPRGYCDIGVAGYNFTISTTGGGNAVTVPTTIANFNILMFARNGNNVIGSVNNGAQVTVSNTNVPITDWGRITLGASPFGSRSSIDLAEFIVYDRYLESSERLSVHRDLSNKYGISIS